MNLAIDIGNTLVKIAVFDNGQLTGLKTNEGISVSDIQQFVQSYPDIKAAVIVSVKDFPASIEDYLRGNFRFLRFDSQTPIPLTSAYSTPETLGSDRLAAAIAAHSLMPVNDVLVINAGTAITYDIITGDGTFRGGAISPGLMMRFKALHTFTGRLPLLNIISDTPVIGQSTNESILSGVLYGTIAEMDGMIERYGLLFPGINAILSGGDNNYFDKRLKNKTFAIPNLVLTGLNITLEYNLEKSF